MVIFSGWSEGYVADTFHTDRVFREQSPVWIDHVAAMYGSVPLPIWNWLRTLSRRRASLIRPLVTTDETPR